MTRPAAAEVGPVGNLTPMRPPAGFEPLRSSAFCETIGPVLISLTEDGPVVGIEIAPQHANSMSRAHGGLLVTVADVAVGQAAKHALPPGTRAVTASLHASFLGSGRVGEWLEAHSRIERVGRTVAHVSCALRIGDRSVATVAATLALTPPETETGSA